MRTVVQMQQEGIVCHSQPAGKQEVSTARIPAQKEGLSKTKSKTQSETEAVFYKNVEMETPMLSYGSSSCP